MTDNTANFVSANILGQTIYNLSDGSSGVVTGVTAHTITCSGGLSGGTANAWASGNSYAIAFTEASYSASAVQPAISCTLQNLVLQNCATAIASGGANQIGFAFARIQGVQILNTTSDALILKNFAHLRVDHLNLYNVGHTGQIVTAHDYYQPGNSIFTDFYSYVSGNPAYGLKIWSDLSGVASGSSLNYCSFERLQINAFAMTPSSNALLKITANKFSPINGFTFNSSDLEGKVTSIVELDNCNSSTFFATRGDWTNSSQVFKIGTGCRWSCLYSDNQNTTLNHVDNSSEVFAYGVFATVNAGGTGYIPRGAFTDLSAGGMTVQGSNVYGRGLNVGGNGDPYMIRPSSRTPSDYNSTPYGLNWAMRQFVHVNQGNINNIGYDQAGCHLVSNNSNDTLTITDARKETEYLIKKTSNNANTITISVTGGLIDGASTYVLSSYNKYVRLVMDGTNAFVIAAN